jgi:N-acetylglucosaminyldiphosphoundecaprenol N-acetyl-beta-D-mannosaminyltransferase
LPPKLTALTDGAAGGDVHAQFKATQLMGMSLDLVRQAEVLDRMFADLGDGRGGWLVTVNLDILRRHYLDSVASALYASADLRVADGMPLVWASRLMGRSLPERVAGSSLAVAIAERAAREGRSLCLLGGAPGAAEGAGRALQGRLAGLRVVGTHCPRIGAPPTAVEVQSLVEQLAPQAPDVVLVGLGSPKQEHVIAALRPHLPRAWMIGVGGTFSFLSGQVSRAPLWMQRAGLEWTHRLSQEPQRLARRYLVDDLPFALLLFGTALVRRLQR